jgi:ribosome-associated translation inhibitor RaiA
MIDKVEHKMHDLERLCDRITSCRVVIDAPHQHHHRGKTYHVSIELSVPGAEIVVNRDPGRDHAHEDVYVAIRDAFDAASRQLKSAVGRSHGEEKRHEGRDPL